MAKRKPTKNDDAPKKRGAPLQHEAGFMRTTVIIPLDLLAEIDRLSASWYVTSGAVMKRSEVLRAALRAMLLASREGKLEGLTTCKNEDELTAVLHKKLAR